MAHPRFDPTNPGRGVVQMLGERLAEHERVIQGVGAAGPIDVPFAYTIHRLGHTGPDTIMFGLSMGDAGHLLNMLHDEHADLLRDASSGPVATLSLIHI